MTWQPIIENLKLFANSLTCNVCYGESVKIWYNYWLGPKKLKIILLSLFGSVENKNALNFFNRRYLENFKWH